MTAPRRLQRSRARGWRMPPGALYVGRPTRWGNPFRITDPAVIAAADAAFRHTTDRSFAAADAAKLLYRGWLDGRPEAAVAGRAAPTLAAIRCDLAGHDLVCWCPPHQPCHADVLLRLANGDPT